MTEVDSLFNVAVYVDFFCVVVHIHGFSLIIVRYTFVLSPRFQSMPGYGQLFTTQETLTLLRYLFFYLEGFKMLSVF